MPRLAAVRDLDLEFGPTRGRRRHLSAASGLVAVGRRLYVVADDEHHLGVFALDDPRAAGSLVRLRAGTLPAGKKARKRAKPDFEVLTLLPPLAGCPHGALLAMGSGSRRERQSAVMVPIASDGAPGAPVRAIDLSPWYSVLAREFDDLNVEGAFVAGGRLCLLQRGNKGERRNARIRLALAPILEALGARRSLPRAALVDVTDFSLGEIDGVPLGFTDGAALAGGFAFTAVAEDTGDSYADGGCAGAAIGIIGGDDRLRALWRLRPALKVEGIAVRAAGRALGILVVTDADDASVPARLLEVDLRLR